MTASHVGVWLVLVLLGGSAGCHQAPAPDVVNAQGATADASRRREFWATYARASDARAAGRLEDAV